MSSNSIDSFRKLHAVAFDYTGRVMMFFSSTFCSSSYRAVNSDLVVYRLKIKWNGIIAMEYSI